MIKLSDKLILLRKENAWSQEDFAEKLDVSRQAISRWENGTAFPDAQNLLRISKLFNVTVDYLLNDDYQDKVTLPNEEPNAVEAPEAEKAPEAGEAPEASEAVDLATAKRKTRRWLPIVAICFLLLVCSAILWSRSHLHLELGMVTENEVAPTCKSEGSYDEVVYCLECNKELLRTTKRVAKLAHIPSSSVKANEIAPTCQIVGSHDEVVSCTVCGDELVRTHRTVETVNHVYERGKCILCDEYKPSEDLVYMSNGDGTCFVSSDNCMDAHIVIPEYSPSGEKVTGIRASGFAGLEMKSVYIPETVTFIGEAAFMFCYMLESVNLPSGITTIYPRTFKECWALKEITIPSGVTVIGAEAFSNCFACQNLVIPASVTIIGINAFCNFSCGTGSITFEVYEVWYLYDASNYYETYVDFKGTSSTPLSLLADQFNNYAWKRHL